MGFFDIIEEVIVEEEILTGRGGYGMGYGGPHIAIDPLNGDIIEDFGGGIGIDLDNGDMTVDDGPFGFDL